MGADKIVIKGGGRASGDCYLITQLESHLAGNIKAVFRLHAAEDQPVCAHLLKIFMKAGLAEGAVEVLVKTLFSRFGGDWRGDLPAGAAKLQFVSGATVMANIDHWYTGGAAALQQRTNPGQYTDLVIGACVYQGVCISITIRAAYIMVCPSFLYFFIISQKMAGSAAAVEESLGETKASG